MQVGTRVDGEKNVQRGGTITEIDGPAVLVDWGWAERWEALDTLRPAAGSAPRPVGIRCDECGRPVPDAVGVPAYCKDC